MSGASEYGANSAAVREPSEPSRKAFSAPVLSHGSVEPHSLRSASSFASGIVKSQPLGDARGQLPFLAQLLIDQEILLAERNVAADFKVRTILQRGDAVTRGIGENQFDAVAAFGRGGRCNF